MMGGGVSKATGGLRGLHSAWGGTWGREGLGSFSEHLLHGRPCTEVSYVRNGDVPQRWSLWVGAVQVPRGISGRKLNKTG